MRIRPSSWVLLSAMGAGLAFGCATDGDGDGDIGTAYLNKLQACGLLTDGELPMVDASEVEPVVLCYSNCLLNATCEEVEAVMCDPLGIEPSESLIACYEACGPIEDDEEEFVCVDGDTIPADWECDGFDDCGDNSDELDCVPFTCVDGTGSISQANVCNGQLDCGDGSDELDCPGFGYTCANGQMVVDDARCDFSQDCDDGSDEAGCAQIICPEPEPG